MKTKKMRDEDLVFIVHAPQDPSVGIFPYDATVVIDGCANADKDFVEAARELLKEAFVNLFDDAHVSVFTPKELNLREGVEED